MISGTWLGSVAGGKRSDGEKKVRAVAGDSAELPSRHVLDFSLLLFSLCLHRLKCLVKRLAFLKHPGAFNIASKAVGFKANAFSAALTKHTWACATYRFTL